MLALRLDHNATWLYKEREREIRCDIRLKLNYMELLLLLHIQLLLAVSWDISSVVTAAAGFSSELLEEWEGWKTQHGKSYRHGMEELERHLIWASNWNYIEEHNANSDLFGYTLAMNQFGDLVCNVCTQHEVSATL